MKNLLNKLLQQIQQGNDVIEQINGQTLYISLKNKIPFILITPTNVQDGQTLILETNNKETSNQNDLFAQALGELKILNDGFNGSAPILIPVLPGSSLPYYQHISNECFANGDRPDLDVIECIDKAKEIMKNNHNVRLNDKIFLSGYSTTGVFAQRFAKVHPKIIDTACIGAAIGSIPVSDPELDYPLGIKNFEEIFGQPFDEESYKKIIFDFYVGELEDLTIVTRQGVDRPMHDMSYFEQSIPTKQGEAYRKKYGEEMFKRADTIIKLLKGNGYNISYEILGNIAHNADEAQSIMANDSSIVGAKGILSCYTDIIKKSYDNMIERNKQKNDSQNKMSKGNIYHFIGDKNVALEFCNAESVFDQITLNEKQNDGQNRDYQ